MPVKRLHGDSASAIEWVGRLDHGRRKCVGRDQRGRTRRNAAGRRRRSRGSRWLRHRGGQFAGATRYGKLQFARRRQASVRQVEVEGHAYEGDQTQEQVRRKKGRKAAQHTAQEQAACEALAPGQALAGYSVSPQARARELGFLVGTAVLRQGLRRQRLAHLQNIERRRQHDRDGERRRPGGQSRGAGVVAAKNLRSQKAIGHADPKGEDEKQFDDERLARSEERRVGK